MTMDKQIKREAAHWFVKLRAGEITHASRQAHAQWLDADPSHREAFASVAGEWADLANITPWAHDELAQLSLKSHRSNRRRAAIWSTGIAAAVTIVAAAALFWPGQQIPSAHYQTAKAEQRQIPLEDGSRMHLNSASSADVLFTPETRAVTLTAGEGVFDVGHDGSRPFVVRTSNYDVIALGTRFAVKIEREGVEVTVIEGRVAVVPHEHVTDSNPDTLAGLLGSSESVLDQLPASSMILTPDEQVNIRGAGPLPTAVRVDAGSATAWQEGKLIFNETPLYEVVEEISRYSQSEIRVASDVPNDPVTGILQIRSTEVMLELLSKVVSVTPVKQSASLIVLHKNS